MTDQEKQQRQSVIDEARSWLKTPYHHEGRVRQGGVDCAMLLAAVYCNVGLIPYFDPRPYPIDWHLHRSAERYLGWVEQFAHRIDGPPLPGDVVLYKYGRCFSHGAIVLGWPLIIHSAMGEGCVVADVTNLPKLQDRESIFYSFWGAA